MDTVYVLGAFFPKGREAGEDCEVKYHIPIKVTTVQEDLLRSFPELMEPFLIETYKRLQKFDPDIVVQYEADHAFGLGDPTNPGLKQYLDTLNHLKEIEQLFLNLTDYPLEVPTSKLN